MLKCQFEVSSHFFLETFTGLVAYQVVFFQYLQGQILMKIQTAHGKGMDPQLEKGKWDGFHKMIIQGLTQCLLFLNVYT